MMAMLAEAGANRPSRLEREGQLARDRHIARELVLVERRARVPSTVLAECLDRGGAAS